METQLNESEYPNRRRPWTAVFLSLLMPGLGQIYCGDIKSGIAVMSVMAIFSVLWVFGILHKDTPVLPPSLMMGGVCLLAGVFAAIDAWRKACRTRYDYKLKDYNRWPVYVMLIWISSAGVVGYTALFRNSMAEAFCIGGYSMSPAIMKGDRLLADKTAYDKMDPQRGDVVLFKNPENRKQSRIKRIVALGGDTVECKNGQLLINGRPLERQWVKTMALPVQKKIEGDVFYEINNGTRYQVLIAKPSPDSETAMANFGPVSVLPYHCFVMGDNRSESEDSRQFGCLSIGAIKGKFRYIYWPGRDWSRFGNVE
jgi:signal peptidase I